MCGDVFRILREAVSLKRSGMSFGCSGRAELNTGVPVYSTVAFVLPSSYSCILCFSTIHSASFIVLSTSRKALVQNRVHSTRQKFRASVQICTSKNFVWANTIWDKGAVGLRPYEVGDVFCGISTGARLCVLCQGVHPLQDTCCGDCS